MPWIVRALFTVHICNLLRLCLQLQPMKIINIQKVGVSLLMWRVIIHESTKCTLKWVLMRNYNLCFIKQIGFAFEPWFVYPPDSVSQIIYVYIIPSDVHRSMLCKSFPKHLLLQQCWATREGCHLQLDYIEVSK